MRPAEIVEQPKQGGVGTGGGASGHRRLGERRGRQDRQRRNASKRAWVAKAAPASDRFPQPLRQPPRKPMTGSRRLRPLQIVIDR